MPRVPPRPPRLLRLRLPHLVRLVLLLGVLSSSRPAIAHQSPFSYLDLFVTEDGVTGTLVVHDFDAAHDLGIAPPEALLDPAFAQQQRDALVRLLAPRLSLALDGRDATVIWGTLTVAAEIQCLRLAFTVRGEQPTRPTRIGVDAIAFPYDPRHQTFVNVYEDGTIRHQAILDARRHTSAYYSGSSSGVRDVVRTFVASGIEHILIGPDHILFLVGLLLPGGRFRRLVAIVTAFTIGHSITLSLAVLDLLAPPIWLVEPLIALTVVVVGADNLLVVRGTQKAGVPSDIRPWLAGAFGLIHGFGFASVLKEFGLPHAALGWSLFSFNVGVEIGQLAIVAVVAGALALLGACMPTSRPLVARWGSAGVIVAGAYWFVERVFLV